MAKYKAKVISISLPKDINDTLDSIIKEAREGDIVVSKSSIILDALMLYFRHCQKITASKVEELKQKQEAKEAKTVKENIN